MDDEKRELVEALAWMCEQYLSTPEGLDHMCMCAGEMALQALEKQGLVDSTCRGAHWTKKGEELLENS